MKKILALLVATAAALLGAITDAAPAQASYCTSCSHIYHYTPDGGVTGPIRIRCDMSDAGTGHYLYPGQDSRTYCNGTDALGIHNDAGEKISCLYGGSWIVQFAWTGWYTVTPSWSDGAGCVKIAN